MSKVKYFPKTPAEYQRSPIPSAMRQMPIKNTKVRFHDMVACGSSNENEKSNAIPVHQSSAMRIREPLSRACAEPLARFTLHATISGSIHDANAPQNIRA